MRLTPEQVEAIKQTAATVLGDDIAYLFETDQRTRLGLMGFMCQIRL